MKDKENERKKDEVCEKKMYVGAENKNGKKI